MTAGAENKYGGFSGGLLGTVRIKWPYYQIFRSRMTVLSSHQENDPQNSNAVPTVGSSARLQSSRFDDVPSSCTSGENMSGCAPEHVPPKWNPVQRR